MRYLLLVLFLVGCGPPSVSVFKICTKAEIAYRCMSASMSTIAICATKEQCNEICLKLQSE